MIKEDLKKTLGKGTEQLSLKGKTFLKQAFNAPWGWIILLVLLAILVLI